MLAHVCKKHYLLDINGEDKMTELKRGRKSHADLIKDVTLHPDVMWDLFNKALDSKNSDRISKVLNAIASNPNISEDLFFKIVRYQECWETLSNNPIIDLFFTSSWFLNALSNNTKAQKFFISYGNYNQIDIILKFLTDDSSLRTIDSILYNLCYSPTVQSLNEEQQKQIAKVYLALDTSFKKYNRNPTEPYLFIDSIISDFLAVCIQDYKTKVSHILKIVKDYIKQYYEDRFNLVVEKPKMEE